MKKNVILVSLLLALSIMFVGCDEVPTTTTNEQVNQPSGEEISNEEIGEEEQAVKRALADSDKYVDVEKNPVVTMKIKDYGTVTMELYPQIAPESVENFISLINKGFYNGLIFHRTIPGFMAQGGDPEGNGSGGPDYSIVGEFTANGFTNELTHERGLLSMARSTENNSAGSQFFIVTTDSIYLDGSYAGFGRVIEGMDVVDKVVNVEVLLREDDIDISKITTIEEYIEAMSKCDRPVNPPVIESMTVDTFGVTYDEPEKIIQEVAE